MVVLYSANLYTELTYAFQSAFFLGSSGFSISSVNSHAFYFSLNSFYFFLLALLFQLELLVTLCWTEGLGVEILIFSLNFMEKPLSMTLAIGLCKCSLSGQENVPLFLVYREFHREWMSNFVGSFFLYQLIWSHDLPFFSLLMVNYTE